MARIVPHIDSPTEVRRSIQRLESHFFDESSDVDHDATTNFVVVEHIDHSTVSILAGTGLSGGGTIDTNRTLALSHLGFETLTDPGADRIVFWDESANAFKWLMVGANLTIIDTTLTAAGGVTDHGALTGLTDDDHTLYLLADGTRNLTGNLTVTAAITIDGRDISVDGAKLDTIETNADVTDAANVAAAGAAMAGGAFHDGFSDFVANEHINHTSVSVIAETGLTGGGDISSSRTLALSHLGIEALTDPGANRILFWDDTLGSCRWIELTDGLQLGGGIQASVFGSLAGVDKWVGGVRAGNGCIYGVPYDSTTVLKIDPSDDSTTTFGSLTGGNKWNGGVLAVNGYIYCIPRDSTTILKIDSSNDSTSTFGSLAGSDKWSGGVLADNGYIYGIPFDSTTVLKIDPSDDSTSTFGSLSGGDKWQGGVLAANGCIYGVPFDSTTILKIDTSDDSVTTFGSLAGGDKWVYGVLAGNGCIYCIPYDSTTILKIDTSDDSTSTFGSLTDGNKWIGGVLADDGCIYGIPADSTTILKIDPSDDSVTTFDNLVGTSKWQGGVLAGNGCIFGIPFDSTTVLKISFDTGLSVDTSEVDHDTLLNYDANDHIDHTSVILTAGSGLAGGGTISANRTFDLDINSLAAATIAAGDFIPFWDITATATNKKIAFSDFEATLKAESLATSLTSGSVVFSNGTHLTQDNATFFWDNSGKKLGLGSVAPSYPLHVQQAAVGRVAGFYATNAYSIGDETLIHIGGANLAAHYGVEIGSAPEQTAPSAHRCAFIIKANDATGTDHVEVFRVNYQGAIGIRHAEAGAIANCIGTYVIGKFQGAGRVTGTVAAFNAIGSIESGATAGTTTNLKAGNYAIQNNDADTIITYGYGLTIDTPINAGTITNTRGIWIGTQTAIAGTQTNIPYGIYQQGTGDYNYFGGHSGFGTTIPTAYVDINSDIIRLRTAKTPASASDTGNAGDICWDADFIYVCVATDTWKKASIATW